MNLLDAQATYNIVLAEGKSTKKGPHHIQRSENKFEPCKNGKYSMQRLDVGEKKGKEKGLSQAQPGAKNQTNVKMVWTQIRKSNGQHKNNT